MFTQIFVQIEKALPPWNSAQSSEKKANFLFENEREKKTENCTIGNKAKLSLNWTIHFRKRVSSHIWQPSNIYGNPATFNKRERNHERLHPKHFN